MKPFSWLLLLFIFHCSLDADAAGSVSAENAVLDLRQWQPQSQPYSVIDGDWRFFWREWIPPAQAGTREDGVLAPLTRQWAGIPFAGREIPGQGYASYFLKILPPSGSPPLAILIPRFRRDYRAYVNGKLVVQSGAPSRTAPMRIVPHAEELIPLPAGASSHELVLHLSNHVDYFGKAPQPALIGLRDSVDRERFYAISASFLSIGAGLFFGAKYWLLFALRRRYAAYFWLGLLSFNIALHQVAWVAPYYGHIRALFADQTWIIRSLIISTILLFPIFGLFLRSLYPTAYEKRFVLAILAPILLGVALSLLTPSPVFTLLLLTWTPFIVMLHGLLVQRAVRLTQEKGLKAIFVLFSTLFLSLLTFHDMLWLSGLVVNTSPLLFNFAVLLLLLSLLLDHYDLDLYDQVKQLSGKLQAKVDERTRELAEKLQQLQRKGAELTSACQQAETANRSKSRFLAAASHDLRQPLHAMGLQFDQLHTLLDNPPDIQQARQVLGKIEQVHQGLGDTLSALLDISRLDNDGIKPRLSAFLLQNVFANLNDDYLYPAAQAGLEIRIRPTRALVQSDPLLLKRILSNLLDNAIKYGAKPGILLAARQRGASWSIEVWDTGIGISESSKGEVFREFVQLDTPARDGRQGLGLGLSIVDRLCRVLGHGLSLASRPQRGTCVKLLAPAGNVLAIKGSAQGGRSMLDRWYELRGSLIMLIEDDPAVLAASRALLAAWGCAVIAATGLEDALRQAEDEQIDLVLADYRLADGHTGIEAIERLDVLQGKRHKGIIITGEAAPETLQAIADSAYPVLCKPVSPLALRGAIHRVFLTPFT